MGGKKHSKNGKHLAKRATRPEPKTFLQKIVSRRDFIKGAALGAAGLGLGAYATNRLLFNSGSHALKAESDIFRGDAPKKPWKWSCEAMHYTDLGADVQCLLCPHLCRLSPGDRGICRARANIDGKLYSLVYGNPCSANVDPVEKKPLFHFLPGTKSFSIATAGCNLRCLNCQNWQISQSRPEDTRNTELFPDAVVTAAKQSGSASIAYTYSEPSTFYEYMHDTSKLAKAEGIRNIWVTAGYLNRDPLIQLSEVIDAANIDLKGFVDGTYNRLNGARLKPVLDTIKTAVEKGIWVELTWLVVPTWTDDMDVIRKGMKWIHKNIGPDYPVHFSAFTPLHKLTSLPRTPVATLERAREIAMEVGMKYVYIGNVPGHHAQNTYCPGCGEIVMKRKGYSTDLSNFKDGACGSCGEKIAGVWR